MKNKKFITGIIVFIVIIIPIILFFFQKTKTRHTTHDIVRSEAEPPRRGRHTDEENQVEHYTCGMHPSVKVSPEEYKKGDVNCPICNMRLIPVYSEVKSKKEKVKSEEAVYYGCGMEGEEHVFQIQEIEGMTTCPMCGMPLKKLSKEEADKLKGVVSRVKIKGEQAELAGVMTEPVKREHLFKEIRTIGRVAYDPELAVTEEEFISSLKALEKIEEGTMSEIKERAGGLAASARKKLRLLGLSDEQIDELAETKQVHGNLILPEEKIWIYGDAYEYELSWIKTGEKIEVTSSSLPGEIFYGVISSINPVLDSKTRSLRFRAEVDNPELKLKPQMYVDIIIKSAYTGADGGHMVLAIPKSAVLDTGMRKIVWVDTGGGGYEGRAVKVGPEATAVINGDEKKFYPVLSGLSEGDEVVTKANFLIDSQSQLSGVASSAYGGALGADEDKKAPMVHQH